MPSAKAHVPTDRASRYLVQLCKHLNHQGRHLRHRPRTHRPESDVGTGAGAGAGHPAFQAQLTWDDNDATIDFGQGRCTVHAAAETLAFRADAEDEQTLHHIEQLIADHLARFSRRNPLTVCWEASEEHDTRTGMSG